MWGEGTWGVRGEEGRRRRKEVGKTSGNPDLLSLALAVFGERFLEMPIVGRGRG